MRARRRSVTTLGRIVLPALAVLVLAAPVPAAALAPSQTGWWWRAQAGLVVDVPPPPQVPQGGLYVEGAPDGPSAVSALRFRVPDDSVGIALHLRVADEQGGEDAVLLLCPARSPWVPAHAGRWDARPQAACEGRGVLGSRAEDGSSWHFPLELLSFTGTRDLVLLPGADESRPEGLDGSVFAIAFEPPGPEALVMEDADMRDDSVPPRPPVFVPPTDAGTGTEGGAPPVFGGTVEPPAVDQPAPQVEDPSVITPRVSTPAPSAEERTASAPASRDARALATLIALVSVGVAGVLSRDRLVAVPGLPARAAGDEREGGIGRFRRPRSSPPPPL